VDHSPWVQAVLLGIHDKGASHTLRTVAPAKVFWKSGVMMPAASFNGDTWQLESADILERLGYEKPNAEDLLLVRRAWKGVERRTDRIVRFFHEFSVIRDPNPSGLRRCAYHFLRSFTSLYMFVVIRSIAFSDKISKTKNYSDQFVALQARLEESGGAFLGGDCPQMGDLMLFGIVQCHASIPVPVVDALQESPELEPMREWIAAMHERFEGYPHLYSGLHFEPHSPVPRQSTRLERACFWLGLLSMLLLLPFTLGLIVFFAIRVNRETPDADSSQSA
jgi:glutathione S-transferase